MAGDLSLESGCLFYIGAFFRNLSRRDVFTYNLLYKGIL
jgi:hypothetical protein